MSQSLGLSVGMTNLVGLPSVGPPVLRRSILTLFPGRAPEVGTPAPTGHGMALAGFVERVGDPIPLVAADGSTHRPGRLLVEALNSLAHVCGRPPTDVAIAVPAHWDSRVLSAFRSDVSANARLCPAGTSAQLISDATAALTALYDNPGLPSRGVVALLDLGGTGTSITLSDAASGWAPIGATVRDADFAGQQIDQAVLARVLSGVAEAANIDPDSTGAVLSLSRLRDQCRIAKEQLSGQTVATITAELPGFQSNVRLTRTELEDLLSDPLAGLLAALEDTLDRNRIPIAEMVAIAIAGGSANIPLVTQRLSQHFRIPVVTGPHPELAAAAGAALIAARGPAAPATALTPAAGVAAASAAADIADDNPASQTFRALAWSEDIPADDVAPYSAPPEDYGESAAVDARPQLEFLRTGETAAEEEPPLAWYRRPQLLFGAAIVAVLLTGGGLTYTLTSSSGSPVPAPATVPAAPLPVESAPPPLAPPAPAAPNEPPKTVVIQQAPQAPRNQPRPQAPRNIVPAPQVAPPSAASSTTPTPTTTSASPTTTTPTTTTPTTTTTTTPVTTTPVTTTPGSAAPRVTDDSAVSSAAPVATPQVPVGTPKPPDSTEAPVDTPAVTIPQFTLPQLPGL